MAIKKCKTCGEEYQENKEDLNYLPRHMRESMKYRPSCDCYEKELKKKQEDQIKENIRLNREARMRKYKSVSVIDSKFKKSRFDNVDQEKVVRLGEKFTKSFIKHDGTDQGLMLYGSVGTGKTLVSACISNELMDQNYGVMAISLGQYLSKIKSEYNKDKGNADIVEKDLLELCKECDLLIIDDFGIEKTTEWAIEKIFNLIDARYRAEKSIIITTNLNFNEDRTKCEIMQSFDEKGRIRDRIVEMCYPFFVDGPSKRKVRKNDFMEFIND